MIGDDKRGKFLQFLRKKKGLTQQELAEMIQYTDKNISKWENGKSFPTNPNTIEKLAQIFNVSFEEIMYGELKNKDNEENIVNNVKEEYLSSYNRHVKIIRYIIISILTIVIIFFILVYYLYIKNSIFYYVGSIKYNDDESNKITLLITNKINVFNFNKLDDPEDKIDNIAFYYIDNNEEKLIFKGNNNNYYIEERNMYNAYNFRKLISSESYLIINYKDNKKERIKVNFKINYNNDNIFPQNTIIESNEKNPIADSQKLIRNLENNEFKKENNYYFKEIDKNVICRYYYDLERLEIVIDNDDVIENLYTYIDSSQIFYERFENGDLIENKEIDEKDKMDCTKKKCKTINEFSQYINYLKYE